MSTNVLPSLAGLAWPITRTPIWDTIVQTSVAGNETRSAVRPYPRWQWDVPFEFLRQGSVMGSSYTEFAQLAGFVNSRQGMFDSFLYQDQDDNSVTGQSIGTGDGSTKTFQLVRTLGGFVEPILAPNTVSHVYNNGTDSGGWTASNWGSATPGVITYSVAPAAGHVITADFTYYWPCRFLQDSFAFGKFLGQFYELKKCSFISVFN